MHMLFTTLSATYQGTTPHLTHTQNTVNQLHRCQLHFVLTGELSPTLTNIITHIQSTPAPTTTPTPLTLTITQHNHPNTDNPTHPYNLRKRKSLPPDAPHGKITRKATPNKAIHKTQPNPHISCHTRITRPPTRIPKRQLTLKDLPLWHPIDKPSHNTNAPNLKPETQNSKEPPPSITTEPTPYSHPQITAALLNTRAMHSSILDLQEIFTNTPHPNIICLTETKHGHIKSTWRNLLKDYKLIHTPSTLDPHTNRRSGGTILGVRRSNYKLIQTVLIPKHIKNYVAAATLEPAKGSTILALSVYMPQHSTKEDKQTYQLVLDWISHLLVI